MKLVFQKYMTTPVLMRRITNERKRFDSTWYITNRDDAGFGTTVGPIIRRDDVSGFLYVPVQYPFRAPELNGLGNTQLKISYWMYFFAIVRVGENAKKIFNVGGCLCCCSPLCSWYAMKTIDECMDYMACVEVMNSTHPIPTRLSELPPELIDIILNKTLV